MKVSVVTNQDIARLSKKLSLPLNILDEAIINPQMAKISSGAVHPVSNEKNQNGSGGPKATRSMSSGVEKKTDNRKMGFGHRNGQEIMNVIIPTTEQIDK